jgi:hypothetical protein
MWAQLKDGFKEFAADALKEGGELVKDTADTTASAAAKVTERAAVVTETISKRLDLDRAEDTKNQPTGVASGSSSRASRPSVKSGAPSAKLLVSSGSESWGSSTAVPTKPTARAVPEAFPVGSGDVPSARGKKHDVADAVSEAISEALTHPGNTTEDDLSKNPSKEPPEGTDGIETSGFAKTDTAPDGRVDALDDLRIELDLARERAAESDRRAVDLAERLATALAEHDARSDSHALAMEGRVKSLKEDNEEMHRLLEDVKKKMRALDHELVETREALEISREATASAVSDMEAAEAAAAAMRKQASETEDASSVSAGEFAAKASALAAALRRAETAETAAATAIADRKAAESARRAAEREAALAADSARSAIAEASDARFDREEAARNRAKFKEESERRASTFSEAVREAVETFREGLTKERDDAVASLEASRKRTLETNEALRAAIRRAERAEGDLRVLETEKRVKEHAAETASEASFAAAKRLRASEKALKADLESSRAKFEAADAEKTRVQALFDSTVARLESETRSLDAATRRIAECETRLSEASASAERARSQAREIETTFRKARETSATAIDALEAELEKTRAEAKRLETLSNAAEASFADERLACGSTGVSSASSVSERLTKRGDVEGVHSSSASSGEFLLRGLGLESVRVLGDGGATQSGSGVLRSSQKRHQASGGFLTKKVRSSFGAVSLRTWLLVAYLVCLHVMAMVTPRHNVGCAIDQDKHRLPGL